MTSSLLMYSKRSLLKVKTDKSDNLSWEMTDLKCVFINFKQLKDRSPVALETGTDKKIYLHTSAV